MTPALTVPRGPRFRSPDALAVSALDTLGEAVAVVEESEILFDTEPFRAKAGEEGLPPVVERLIAAGGGLDDGGPEGTVAEVRGCPLPSGRSGWVVRLREPDEGLALLDPLTGLPNRRAFETRLAEEVARSRRSGRPLGLVLLDLDHFKRVNDEHGHPVGDAVLAGAGRRLRSAARPGDVLARVGGEEFAWLLPEAGAEDALAAADRARAAVSGEPLAGLRVTASAGVVDLGRAGDGEALYRLADEALYWSKAGGRDLALAWTARGAARMGGADGEDAWTRLQRDARDVERAFGDPPRAEVARVAVALAVALDWPAPLQAELHRAALVRDAGKLLLLPEDAGAAVPPARLALHPRVGAALAAAALGPEACAWIRRHDDAWDGGEAKADGAQLIALAEAYVSLTTDGPGRAAVPAGAALAEIEREAGARFRPDAAELLRRALRWLG